MIGREAIALLTAAFLFGVAAHAPSWRGLGVAAVGVALIVIAGRWHAARLRGSLPFEAARHTLLNAALRLYRAREERRTRKGGSDDDRALREERAAEMLDEAAEAFVRRAQDGGAP